MALDKAYDWFRTQKMGQNVSPATLAFYDYQLKPLVRWLAAEHSEVVGLDTLTANHLREYSAFLTQREKKHGGKLAGESLVTSHKAIRSFLNWGRDETDASIDPKLFRLKKPTTPDKDATVYSIDQLRQILAVCENDTEQLVVCLLVGAGLRLSEAIGFAMLGPDGQPNLITDPYDNQHFMLRVLWDAGAKGKKSRYVPISAKLAVRIKKFVAVHGDNNTLISNRSGRAMTYSGMQSLMNRLERRAGFRITAHCFRHTYATVSTQQDVNMEKLRQSMGHADYDTLLGYVRLAGARNLGPGSQWQEFLYVPAHKVNEEATVTLYNGRYGLQKAG